MSMNDNATRYVTYVEFLVSPDSTVVEYTDADLAAWYKDGTAVPGFEVLGHTSAEEVFALESEGGETSVIGSFQNRALEEISTEQAIEMLKVKSLQVADPETLKLYYGGGTVAANRFSVPIAGTPSQRHMLVLMRASRGGLGLDAKRTSIFRDEAISLPSDNFVQVPLRATLLGADTVTRYDWILPEAFEDAEAGA